MNTIHDITILPHGRHVQAKSGQSLKDALAASSILIRSDCGGRGSCGKCRVNIISPTGKSKSITSCNYTLDEDIRIEIPKESLVSFHVLGKASVCLPSWFLKGMNRKESQKPYGIAVDLGTTTMAVYLCNTLTGEVVSSVSMKNPQAAYGDDVMSRIGWIREDKDNLNTLQNLVVLNIEQGILELLRSGSLETSDLTQMVIVGNPTMIHILLGVNPESIGMAPYRPAFFEARTIDSTCMGFNLNHVFITTLPQVSGFIGGDIISAALATNLDQQPDGTILVDLGTNGELLMKTGDTLFAASCATGPAFEGASLSCGIQAIPGAINKVIIKDTQDFPEYSVITSKEPHAPIGLCGTGVISLVAELWRKRVLTPGGAFIGDDTIIPLIKDSDGSARYEIVNRKNQANASIYVSQKDIRAVQMGKAALRAGIEFLGKASGYGKPSKIIIAGAFGTFIDIEDMTAIGMIPEMEKGTIEIGGNSAGIGAIMTLIDDHYHKKSIELSQRIKTIDLANDTGFQKVFVKHLNFS